MGQIEELQGRMATALDRISQGLDLQANTQADASEIDALKQALEDERVATQQLEERNKALNDKIDALTAELSEAQSKDVGFPDVLDEFGASIANAREASQEARDTNTSLRASLAEGVTAPELVNSSMMSELNSLRADRALDRAELQAILETLEAALGGSQPVEGGV